MTGDNENNGGERFTGHGSEWNNSNLSAQDAQTATAWVEQKIDKRSMLTNKDRVEDVRDIMWQLEKDGEIVVHRVTDDHQPVMHKTLYGWDKKIPTNRLWHHKSCGQCGNIPGYPTSLLWLMNELDLEYLDETDQTSCTAWNYHGSGIGNLESLAAVFLRNFHQAYVAAKAEGKPEGYYYPLVHCGTSFGNYKEVRGYLLHSAELRERVKKILAKLGRLVDGKLLIPEEVVHYSEWVHAMRPQIRNARSIDCSSIRATIHPACHVYKMVPEDVIYDDDVLDGNRVAVSTGIVEALGAQAIDYSTWYDCCGFGFRHIISEREFTRSFAIDRKIRVAVEEARADVMIGHDTGCITTLDKNQWIGQGHRQAGGASGPGRLPVRRPDVRRAPLQDRPDALACVPDGDADGETGDRLAGEESRVRGLSERGRGRQWRNPLRPAADDHLRPGLQAHRRIVMSKPVLIVGGGPAGLSAAHALATVGQKSVLVDKQDTLGGHPIHSGYAKLVPSGEWAKDVIGAMVDRVEQNALVEVHKGTTVKSFAGEPGNFTAELGNGTSVDAHRRSWPPAFTHFDSINKPEWGFGTYPDVVTTTQVEQMFSTAPACAAPPTGASRSAWRFCCASGRATARSAANGAPRYAAQCRRTSPWRSARNCRIAMSISTTWISAPSGSTRTPTTGAARKSSRSSTSRRASPR